MNERHRTLLRELEQIERHERSILESLGHSPNDDLNGLLDRIGDRHQVGPKNRKAFFALMALIHLKALKAEIWEGDPVRAASAALRVGAYGGSALHEALIGHERRIRGGKARGRAITEGAAESEETVRRLYTRWRKSSDLQEDYPRSPVKFIVEQTGLHTRAIQRHLKAIRTASSRQ